MSTPTKLNKTFVAGNVLKAEELNAMTTKIDSIIDNWPGETDLSSYAKTSDLSAYAKTSDLNFYAKTADLADYTLSSNVYTKSEIDTSLSSYAKSDDVYTKSEVELLLKDVDTAIAAEATERETKDDELEGRITVLESYHKQQVDEDFYACTYTGSIIDWENVIVASGSKGIAMGTGHSRIPTITYDKSVAVSNADITYDTTAWIIGSSSDPTDKTAAFVCNSNNIDGLGSGRVYCNSTVAGTGLKYMDSLGIGKITLNGTNVMNDYKSFIQWSIVDGTGVRLPVLKCIKLAFSFSSLDYFVYSNTKVFTLKIYDTSNRLVWQNDFANPCY